MKRIKSDRIIREDGLLDGYIYFKNGRIMDVTSAVYPVEEEYDMTGLYVCPGFIDIHTHGGGGNPFEGSVEDIVNGDRARALYNGFSEGRCTENLCSRCQYATRFN